MCVFSAQSPTGVSINKKVSNIFEVVQAALGGLKASEHLFFLMQLRLCHVFFFFLSDTHLLYEVAVLSVISK